MGNDHLVPRNLCVWAFVVNNSFKGEQNTMLVLFAAFDEQQTAQQAVDGLRSAGIADNDISLAATAHSELVQDLMNEAVEKPTAQGATVGAAVGSLLGFAGGLSMFMITGPAEATAAGAVSTAIGGAIGTYLGGIYGNRAVSEDELSVKEALIQGKLLVIVTADSYDQEMIENILRESGGQSITSHDLYAAESEAEAGHDPAAPHSNFAQTNGL
jgi:hypothetical protein